MKIFVFLIIATLIFCSEAQQRYYIHQRNDHFNKEDVSTFKQYYVVNDTFWRGNGHPIFIMVGGESPIQDMEVGGFFYFNEKAVEYGALLLSVEHRFFGYSIPGDGTLSMENLRLLNSDQALADYAVFIDFIKKKYNASDSKVVTFGGSYSGVFSAWMRQKYPNLVDIAYASSAPLQAQLGFPDLLGVVSEAIGSVSPICAARIKEAINKIDDLVVSDPEKLFSDFKPCSEIANNLDKLKYISNLKWVPIKVAMSSGQNFGIGRICNISRMCDIIGTTGDAYESFAAFRRSLVGSGPHSCVNCNYEQDVNALRNTNPNPQGANSRAWYYEFCLEFASFLDTNVELDLNLCKDVFGFDKDKVSKGFKYTNIYHGGRDLRSDKIVFTNGSFDPWHALGLISDTPHPDKMPVIYINGTGHCVDLYARAPTDPPALTRAREQAWSYIDKWLNEK